MDILKIRNSPNEPWQDVVALVGPKGEDGYTPIKGVDYNDGYTPIKGVDYFDGEPGKDGYTPIKDVDYFDGYTPVKGVDYNDGYTPVKGVDYYTEAEKQELVQLVLAAAGNGNEVSY